MKRLLLFLFLILASCKEDVLVVGDFRQQYALFSILNGETDYQIVTITKSYPVEELNRLTLAERFVKNARIRMWLDNDVYILKDSLEVKETSVGTDSTFYYYTYKYKLEPEHIAEVEAILPNGKKLSAKTKIPANIEFDGLNNDRTIPPPFENRVFIAWFDESDGLLYSPRLILEYYREDGGGNLIKLSKKMPMQIINDGVNIKEIYPKPAFEKEIYFDMEAIERGVKEISAGDPDKSKYYISGAVFEVVVFDKNLSAYYVASHFLDEYSIRLDEVDFTNIEGGLGVFGSFMKFEWGLSIDPDYVKNFGYKIYR